MPTTSGEHAGRPRRLFAVLTAGALAAAALCAPAPAAADSPSERPAAIVAMGDSLTAGEGGGAYEPGLPPFGSYCHRSSNAQVAQAGPAGLGVAVNLACSGATTDDVRIGGTGRYGEPPQAEQLRTAARTYDIRTIVLNVGANDIPAAGLTITCAGAYLVPGPPCSRAWNTLLPERLSAMEPRIEKDLRDIRTVMRQTGYDDEAYDLILQSYPSPSSGLSRYSTAQRGLQGCPFQDADFAWVHDVAFPMLSQSLEKAAANVSGVRFLGLSAALQGGQVCAPGITHGGELSWGLFLDVSALSHGIGPDLVSQSLHPNAGGYRQLARCLQEFEQSPARSAECERGTDGQPRLTPTRRATGRSPLSRNR